MTPTTQEIFGLTEHETKRIISAYLEGMQRPCSSSEITAAVDELQRWKIDIHNASFNAADEHEEFLDGPD